MESWRSIELEASCASEWAEPRSWARAGVADAAKWSAGDPSVDVEESPRTSVDGCSTSSAPTACIECAGLSQHPCSGGWSWRYRERMNISVLLSLFIFTPSGPAPDLCDEGLLGPDGTEVLDNSGRNLPRYCEWSGPDVPAWRDNVCCDIDAAGATCTAPDSRDASCLAGSEYYCEYGEPTATGGFVCYQPYPDMCDGGLCVEAPDIPLIAAVTPLISCCYSNGVCVWVGYDSTDCEGELSYCHWAMTLLDGTVECLE